MTARFLLDLREWDYRILNPETVQWDIDEGGQLGDIQFKRSERRTTTTTTTTQWTINDVLGDDSLLKPIEIEVSSEGGSLSSVHRRGTQDREKRVFWHFCSKLGIL